MQSDEKGKGKAREEFTFGIGGLLWIQLLVVSLSDK